MTKATDEEVEYYRRKYDIGKDGRDWVLKDVINEVRQTFRENGAKYEEVFQGILGHDFIIDFVSICEDEREVFESFEANKEIFENRFPEYLNSSKYVHYKKWEEYTLPPISGDLKNERALMRRLLVKKADDELMNEVKLICEENQVDCDKTSFLLIEIILHYQYLIYLFQKVMYFAGDMYPMHYRPYDIRYTYISGRKGNCFAGRSRLDTTQHMDPMLHKNYEKRNF